MPMAIVTGDRYLEELAKFVEEKVGSLIDGTVVLKLNPIGLHYVQSRFEALHELEGLLESAPVDYLRAYVSDLGDYRALEQLRRILGLLTSLKVFSALPPHTRDPTPLCLMAFRRLKVLELRGCDLSTSDARGLLDLRCTLEKIVCHNSTDALRHVFASRIFDIEDTPPWKRLSFVSCACNNLVLMDESLQLLPSVETLDLSRNKFEKVDNLKKCTKLKHLDLGFNHLRTTVPFNKIMQVSRHIVKLVLRNNALTTLRGLENLASLEGLDVSNNIISNLSVLEYLASLPSLRNLWLEGNPICSMPWYRAQVFSYFFQQDRLKLDDKEISTMDFWKMHIIICQRKRQCASFGYYSTAKYNEEEGSISKKVRKASRVASIGNEESTCFHPDKDSLLYDHDYQHKEENLTSDDEDEMFNLIKRVELMNNEQPLLWLQQSDDLVDRNSCSGTMQQLPAMANLQNFVSNQKQIREWATCSLLPHQVLGKKDGSLVVSKEEETEQSLSPFSGMLVTGGHKIAGGKHGLLHSIERDNVVDSTTSSSHGGSAPRYEDDIMHRCQNMVAEMFHLSSEFYSLVSSDSNTSSNEEDDSREISPLSPLSSLCDDAVLPTDASLVQTSGATEPVNSDNPPWFTLDDTVPCSVADDVCLVEEKKPKRKLRKRVILLSEILQ